MATPAQFHRLVQDAAIVAQLCRGAADRTAAIRDFMAAAMSAHAKIADVKDKDQLEIGRLSVELAFEKAKNAKLQREIAEFKAFAFCEIAALKTQVADFQAAVVAGQGGAASEGPRRRKKRRGVAEGRPA